MSKLLKGQTLADILNKGEQMFILLPVVAAVILVSAGYFTMWTASRSDTPKGIAKFGSIMAIILFVFAGGAFGNIELV